MATFENIVSAYIRDYQDGAAREQRWFEIQRTLEETVSFSAMAQGPNGKRLSHQCRIPSSVLLECRSRLLKDISRLRVARSFEELHTAIESIVGDIAGIGELYIYDTALRIGAKLSLRPARVFLHAGVREGAKHLGFDSRKTIDPAELPRAFRKLEPREIEDVLCIYKGQLAGVALMQRRNARCVS